MGKLTDHLLFKISGRLPCRLILLGENTPYLERYYVGELFGVTFYLHRFVSADRERHLHNHPWVWSRALVLSGGYEEEVATDLCPFATEPGESGCLTETRMVRWWNRINGNYFHRVVRPSPRTWTLFFHGARQRVKTPEGVKLKKWGFLENFYGVGLHNVTIFQPVSTASGEWWHVAPKGCEAGRTPL